MSVGLSFVFAWGAALAMAQPATSPDAVIVPTELMEYVARPDNSFSWRWETENRQMMLTSQTWQGHVWEHRVDFFLPSEAVTDGRTAVVFVTGGSPNASERLLAQQVANQAGVPFIILGDIPKQPIEDLREDALIALTFQRYLETGDASWPLLFPMAKSVIRTMDAVQQATRSWDRPVERFVVAGASKRGWTTWLSAATNDERIVGIIPMVYDNLNILAQMEAQQEYWNGFSPQIADYEEAGLLALLESDRGQDLARIVDPFSYLPAISVPVLMIHGANDPYWTVDAMARYWDDLTMPRYAVVVPNAGHGVEDVEFWLPTVVRFVRSIAGVGEMPDVMFSFPDEPTITRSDEFTFLRFSDPPARAQIWGAASDSFWFADSSWRRLSFDVISDDPVLVRPRQLNRSQNVALLPVFQFTDDLGTFHLTGPVRIIPAQP